MPPDHPAAPLLAGLATALEATRWHGARLVPLADTGLAHHHVALVVASASAREVPALARIPKQSQLRLGAAANLEYQAACFARAAPSGHTPRLFEVIAPGPHLARGALIVEHVFGRAAQLASDFDGPDAVDSLGDLDQIVAALASIHALPVPERADRAPLMSADDPLADLASEIDAQARYLDDAQLHPDVRALIDRERASLAALVRRERRPSVSLISFDAHPGNFLVRDDGQAVLVDLEKCRYSYPSLDLAHATLYTSTTWEQGSTAALTAEQIRHVLELWTSITGDTDAAEWHVPLRRAMWLWSATWCAKWRVLSGAVPSASADGEDWAAAKSADSLAQHVRARVDHYLSADLIRRLTDEFDAL